MAGHNYGQGSSREQAALAPLHLGVRAIAAAGYARIHRRNLIAVGIVPLVLADAAERDRVQQGERWHLPGLAAAVTGGAHAVTARTDSGRDVELLLPLSPGERAVLGAGGLLAHIRVGGRTPVAAR